MKKKLLTSYWDGITSKEGNSYNNILGYFAPELISALVIYSLPYLLDELFIAQLKSASTYAAVGLTNSTLVHLLTKIAEGMAVGITVAVGLANGAGKNKQVGKTFVQSLWITVFSGFVISFGIFAFAKSILEIYGFPEEMIIVGAPFLRLKSVGIFLNFLLFSIIGFLRGVKNTRTPMKIFIIGACSFVISDYILIFGKLGLQPMGFLGSAYASIIQQIVMILIALFAIYKSNIKKYDITFSLPSFSMVLNIFNLGWPIIIDKAIMSLCYIWLGKMIAPMGTAMLATYTVVKNIERFAFLPAMAGAQIITFLASNLVGAGQVDNIKNTIKKTLLISTFLVMFLLLVVSCFPFTIVNFFDRTGEFTMQAAKVLPVISFFVFFDIIQLILSAALRGMSFVKLVMKTRIYMAFGFFIPFTYFVNKSFTLDTLNKFLLLYGIFYFSSAMMAFLYVYKFRNMDSEAYKKII